MFDDHFIQQLESIVGRDRLLLGEADRWVYGYDNSRRHAQPDAVALVVTPEEVRACVALCAQSRIPVVARGRGTGTTGATVPTQGGLVLSFENMDQPLEVRPEDRMLIAAPGVTNQAIQEAAAAHGYFWPPDPTSAAYCTLGGNLAYNSAGPRAVKYGTVRENTLGLQAVTGDGRLLRSGVYTTKGVVGYDLTRLLIGSEGTLALFTEATLKLSPLPEARRGIQAIYRDMRSAAAAVSRVMGQPVIPCTLEFIDGRAIEMVRSHAEIELPRDAGAMLMIEVDGEEQSLARALESVARAAAGEGLLRIEMARDESERRALWATRKALSPALRTVAPKKINEDVAVPVSRMAELIGGLEQLSEQHRITIVNFGHAGNGNIHVNLLVNPDDRDEMARATRCLDAVFTLVLSLEGTLSGEHGVGLEKRPFVDRELDPVALDLMRAIKAQFDPFGILNPGKSLPG